MPLILPGNVGSATAATGFNVANSCRFNDASPDILKNGTESDGNRKVWTMSMWIKRSKLGVRQSLWSWGSNSSSTGEIYFDANDFLVLSNDGQQGSSNEVAGVFRDISAWSHIVWRCDVTETNNIDRWRVYINGVQRTLTDAATVTDADGEINKNGTHENWIGGAARSLQSGNPIYPFGGYIAEAVFVDGQALAPTSFGEFDEDSGIWKPIDVSGLTFGDEGVYLNFENAAELGTDVSGNGNTYAETGLAATDQSTDTCTNNFATLNPLNSSSNDSHTPPTYSEGNLQSASPSSGGGYVGSSTIGVTNGKWFWEFKKSGGSATNIYNGIGNEVGTAEIARQSAVGVYFGNQVFYRPDGTKQIITNGSNVNTSYGASWTTNDIIGIALDLDSGTNTVTFYKNGASQGAINLPVNTDTWFFIVACGTDTVDTWQLNFGSPPYAISSGNTDGNGYGNFEYAVPSGYYSLNTKNLAEHG